MVEKVWEYKPSNIPENSKGFPKVEKVIFGHELDWTEAPRKKYDEGAGFGFSRDISTYGDKLNLKDYLKLKEASERSEFNPLEISVSNSSMDIIESLEEFYDEISFQIEGIFYYMERWEPIYCELYIIKIKPIGESFSKELLAKFSEIADKDNRFRQDISMNLAYFEHEDLEKNPAIDRTSFDTI